MVRRRRRRSWEILGTYALVTAVSISGVTVLVRSEGLERREKRCSNGLCLIMMMMIIMMIIIIIIIIYYNLVKYSSELQNI